MVDNQRKKSCYIFLSRSNSNEKVYSLFKKVGEEFGLNVHLISFQEKGDLSVSLEKLNADLLMIDTSLSQPNLYYEIGIAQATGKQIIFLVDSQSDSRPTNLRSNYSIYFPVKKSNYNEVESSLKRFFSSYTNSPLNSIISNYPSVIIRQPDIGDLEELNPREFENLCFELILQIGFKQVEWEKSNRDSGIDIVANLSKRDPDGYEYKELWFIIIGTELNQKELYYLLREPAYFFERYYNRSEYSDQNRLTNDETPTFLFISNKNDSRTRKFEKEIKRFEREYWDRRPRYNFRFRFWSPARMLELLRSYPQIVSKYFSDEAKQRSQIRKTAEELYKENMLITERLQVTKEALEEEKKRRFIAERDAAWKDVAFKAAHKLGNPIDAIDTFLQSLKKRIEKDSTKALSIADEMDTSIEEAKSVIAEFKSLNKILQMFPKPNNIEPIIEHAASPYIEKGVNVTISVRKRCPKVQIDPERITECFQELFANSYKWFDREKEMLINIKVAKPQSLPDIEIDTSISYLKITFEDNGIGIPVDKKEKIFSPFYTSSNHGTGLGLSLVKGTIEGHQGYINEDGNPQKGARFNIYLPISKNK